MVRPQRDAIVGGVAHVLNVAHVGIVGCAADIELWLRFAGTPRSHCYGLPGCQLGVRFRIMPTRGHRSRPRSDSRR